MRVFFLELEDEILVLVAQYRRVDDDHIGTGGQNFLGEVLGAVEARHHVKLRQAVNNFSQADGDHLKRRANDNTVSHG